VSDIAGSGVAGSGVGQSGAAGGDHDIGVVLYNHYIQDQIEYHMTAQESGVALAVGRGLV
jgi:hypothetical protein